MSKVVVMIFTSLLLVGLIVAVTFVYGSHWGKSKEDTNKIQSSTKAVHAICQPTDYKDACFKSMSNANTNDPKELVRAAFKSAKEELNRVTQNSTILQELEKDPRTADAVNVCRELFVDAMDDLQRSFVGLNEFEWTKVNKMMANIKVWLSATITYQGTCIDGFENTTQDASQKVRKVLKMAMQMSSNGLAIINDMSSLLSTIDTTSFHRRRLLAYLGPRVEGHDMNDEGPHWVNVNPYRDHRRQPYLGPKLNGHDGFIPDLTDELKNRRLLNLGYSNVRGNFFQEEELDRRRDMALSLLHDMGPNGEDELPIWMWGDRHRFLLTGLDSGLKHIADIIVAKDGTGKYDTIAEALKHIPRTNVDKFVIYIKEGDYNEYLVVERWMKHVVFVGDGPTKTRITNNKNFVDGTKTYKTATLSIQGDYFMAKDMGIENTAGAEKHQAVALRVQADQSVFYNCHMDGYQDTLYVHTYRQFYRDCRITGTVDFIFGDAAAFFQNCTFVVRKPLPKQQCIVTAQGRIERHQPSGIIIHKCRFEADPNYVPFKKKNKAYLGRPWKKYSRTIIMESYIGDLIQADGWLPWEGDFGIDNCFYSEFNNEGPGAKTGSRVKWRGVRRISYDRAKRFMPLQLFENDAWIKDTGIPYDTALATVLAPRMAPEMGPEMGREMGPELAPVEAPIAKDGFFSSNDNGDEIKEHKTRHHHRHKGGHTKHNRHKKHIGKNHLEERRREEQLIRAEQDGVIREYVSSEQEHNVENTREKLEDRIVELGYDGDRLGSQWQENPMEQEKMHDLENMLMVNDEKIDDGGSRRTEPNVDTNNLAMVQPIYPTSLQTSFHSPSIKDDLHIEPLAIHELERILMTNDEENETKASPTRTSSTTLSHKDPIALHEMERMLMEDEDIPNGAINPSNDDKNTEEATSLHEKASSPNSQVRPGQSISMPTSIASSQSQSTLPKPSIAISPTQNPSTMEGPVQAPSIYNEPSLGPSSETNEPSQSPSMVHEASPTPTPTPHISPSKNYDCEEVQDWLPPPVKSTPGLESPAPTPKHDAKPAADEVASTLPSESGSLGLKIRFEFSVVLTGIAMYVISLIL